MERENRECIDDDDAHQAAAGDPEERGVWDPEVQQFIGPGDDSQNRHYRQNKEGQTAPVLRPV